MSKLEAATAISTWGWLPTLSLICACGLLLVSFADTSARRQAGGAEALFWAGLLLMYAPIVMRLAFGQISRRETIGLVVALGLGLYLVKVLHSPLIFTNHDEFLHWRTADDIITSGRLFQPNPLLPVSALYPGQEIVTSALVSLSGLPIFFVGTLLIGVARLILVLALYLFYEQISRSAQIAGIATAVYMANPNYLFFASMYKYESLAIPFAALVLWALARRPSGYDSNRIGLTTTAMLGLGLVITTHHITSYALAGFLILWTVLVAITRRRWPNQSSPGSMALLAVVANLTWLLFVANITIAYLGGPLSGAIGEVLRLAARDPSAGRQLFRSSAGQIAPLWERMVGFGSVGLILLALPFGLYQFWRQHRRSAIALAIAGTVLLYPVSLAFRLTRRGWESANRSSEVLFVAIGFVFALAVTQFVLRGRLPLLRALCLSACVSILFVGGIIAGWTPAWRLPGPYIPESDTRSIEPQGIAAAEWARQYLGPGKQIGADRTNMLLMGSFGKQHVSTTLDGGEDPGWVLYAPGIGAEQQKTIQKGDLRYVVIDRRLLAVPNLGRSYYRGTTLEQAFAKFDRIQGVSRIFDSGDIAVYDLGVFIGVP